MTFDVLSFKGEVFLKEARWHSFDLPERLNKLIITKRRKLKSVIFPIGVDKYLKTGLAKLLLIVWKALLNILFISRINDFVIIISIKSDS